MDPFIDDLELRESITIDKEDAPTSPTVKNFATTSWHSHKRPKSMQNHRHQDMLRQARVSQLALRLSQTKPLTHQIKAKHQIFDQMQPRFLPEDEIVIEDDEDLHI